MLEIVELNQRMNLFNGAVDVFWKQWGNQNNYEFYRDCMMHSCKSDSDLPGFYIAVENDSIVGFENVYLCTDLDGYYEKYDWEHLTNGYVFTRVQQKFTSVQLIGSKEQAFGYPQTYTHIHSKKALLDK
jgi:hypothetical protein